MRVVAQQVIASLKIISGEDGTDLGMLCVTDYLLHFDFTLLLRVSTGRKRIAQLADNAKFFRQAMKRMGFIIFGLCAIHEYVASLIHFGRSFSRQ